MSIPGKNQNREKVAYTSEENQFLNKVFCEAVFVYFVAGISGALILADVLKRDFDCRILKNVHWAIADLCLLIFLLSRLVPLIKIWLRHRNGEEADFKHTNAILARIKSTLIIYSNRISTRTMVVWAFSGSIVGIGLLIAAWCDFLTPERFESEMPLLVLGLVLTLSLLAFGLIIVGTFFEVEEEAEKGLSSNEKEGEI